MDRAYAIGALRQAVPYLRLYRGQIFVIKCGGEAIQSRDSAKRLLEQISVFQQLGIHVVLVHGGGPQATELATRLGAESEFVEGRRVTNPEMLEAMTLALNGAASTLLLSVCREMEIPAIGLSGVDAGLVRAVKRPPRAGADYGEVGDIVSVQPTPIRHLLDGGYLPIVSPLSASDQGDVLNINADSVASALAVSLGAMKLMFVMGAPGVLRDANNPDSLLSHLDVAGIQALMEQGVLTDGMLPKTDSIISALQHGVARVHIVSYKYPDSLLTEVFTNEGCGTLIVRAEKELLPEEE
jgi:acetylglutamate kinase